MDNFDLKKYLAEGKLLKEAFYPEFEGETNDKINDIAIAVVDELESKLDSESSGILKGMDYYVGSDGMDNDEVEQGFTKWFIDLVKYLSKNNNEVTISSVEQDGKVFTPAITLKYLDNGKEDISWKLKRDLAEGKLLKEDVSPKFIKKYLSMLTPEQFDYTFKGIENIESYSDRDKAIFVYLEEGPGVMVSDKLAKAIKDKSGAEIIQYFQDEMYEYMPYSEMRRVLGVPAVSGFIFDESGSEDGEDWYLVPKIKRKLNTIWRTNYPELDVPTFNGRQFDIQFDLAKELSDYYRGLAREQRGEDLEVSYEEYAENWVQSLKDRIEQLEKSDDKEQREFALKLK